MKQRDVEAIYPAHAMQQAMLFHGLAAREHDSGLLQVRWTLRGPLDRTRFRQAWQQVVARHQALRSSAHAVAGKPPLIMVRRCADLPWSDTDWTRVSRDVLPQRLDEYCREDRRRGLDLSRAPAMRIAMFQAGLDTHHVVWTCHHVLLDGWSAAIVVREVLAAYAALAAGASPPWSAPRTTPESHARWLRQQDTETAERFWRRQLDGFTAPTPLPLDTRPSPAPAQAPPLETVEITLSADETELVRRAVSEHRLTPGTFWQGVWALLLGARAGTDDVVFGVTASGRAAALAGMDSAVGCFANVQPMRARVRSEMSLGPWLAGLRDARFEAQSYEHVPLVDVHGACAVPGHQRLFETLLVFENFPWEEPRNGTSADVRLTDFRGGITSSFPVTLVVAPGDRWTVGCVYDAHRIRAADAAELPAAVRAAAAVMAEGMRRPLGDVLGRMPAGASSPVTVPVPVRGSHSAGDSAAAGFLPPRNPVELELVRIWERLLSVAPVSVRDNYFELGGNSLAAVRLFGEIEQRLGKRLPLALLVERPTIELLAAGIQDEQSASPWQSLVPLQPHGDRPPLFCVHAGGLHVLCYRDLARELGSEQPVYGLQPVGLGGEREPFTRIEEMAAHYVRELRSVQREGPYQLMGYCALGGTVAYEMAQQLTGAGERVSLLAVLDAYPPRTRPPRKMTYQSRGAVAVRRMRRSPWRYVAGGLAKRGAALRRLGYRTWGGAAARRRLCEWEVQQACERAFFEYRARPYEGHVTYVESREFEDGRRDRSAMWSRLVAEIEFHVVPVTHDRMLVAPDVRHVAAILRSNMESAPARTGFARAPSSR